MLRRIVQPGPVKDHKVFGIGFQKTGTTSLGRALEILGYRVCDVRGAYNHDMAEEALDVALAEVDRFDAFEDNPWPLLYREMDERFEDAKFVLTIRPVEKWLDSVLGFFPEDEPIPMHEWIYGEPVPHGNEDVWRKRYEQHNEEVLDYFGDRDDFLVLRVTEGEGWDNLCPFLGEDVPSIPFPHANASGVPDWQQSLYDMRSRARYLFNHYILRR